jgi:isoleucyl-tRNA synthetase
MKMIMQIASLGLKLRAQAGIKIRQPLSELRIGNLEEKKLSKEAVALLKEELNIKQIVFAKLTEDDDWETGEDNNIQIGLKKKISIQLRKEGSLREIIHAVQMLRKDGGLKASHRITLYIQGTPEIEKLIDDSRDLILEENRAEMIVSKSQAKGKLLAQKNLKINSKEIWLGINQN